MEFIWDTHYITLHDKQTSLTFKNSFSSGIRIITVQIEVLVLQILLPTLAF